MRSEIHHSKAQQNQSVFSLLEAGVEIMTQLQVLSCGGGLQSTAIALMSLDGTLDIPDLVLHADTGSEQAHTMATIERLFKLCNDNGLKAEVVRAPEGRLFEWYTARGWVPRPRNGACTTRFKIAPIRRHIKPLVDQSLPKPWITQWVGITADEAHRARESDVQFIEMRYPLIEMGLTRNQVRAWMTRNYPDWEVKKSGCWHCHYQPASEWMKLRKESPELFKLARDMEEAAKATGTIKYGLFGGKTIAGFDYSHTLEDFGLEFGTPEDWNCDSASAGCFL